MGEDGEEIPTTEVNETLVVEEVVETPEVSESEE